MKAWIFTTSSSLGPAQRNAEVDRLQRGRVAAPAVIGFLERGDRPAGVAISC